MTFWLENKTETINHQPISKWKQTLKKEKCLCAFNAQVQTDSPHSLFYFKDKWELVKQLRKFCK